MSRATFKARVIEEATQETELWGTRPILLEVDLPTALRMLGAMQLALRHPNFRGSPGGQTVREIVTAIEQQIPPEFPALHRLIQLGFEQEFDT